MKSKESSPPRWAEAMLRSLLRPSDRESISGDLLEEYRTARRPALGALRANAWYIKHVLSVLWRVIRPCALTLAGLTLLSLMVKGLWYGSLVQAPGVSLLHALIYSKPFIFVILSVMLLLALSYGVLIGAVGGVIGRRVAPTAPPEVRVS